MDKKIDINQLIKVQNIIWLYFVSSICIVIIIGIKAISFNNSINDHTYQILRTVFYSLSLIIAVFNKRIKKALLSEKVQKYFKENYNANNKIENYKFSLLLMWIISEMICLFSLILYINKRNIIDFYLLLPLAFYSFIINRPKKDEFIKISQNNPEISTYKNNE